MKVAIDISPTIDKLHSVRGVGSYITNLKNHINEVTTDLEIEFFTTDVPHADLIHYPYFDPFQRAVKKVSGAKTIVTVHDLTPIVFKDYFPVGLRGNVNWQLNKFFLRSVDAIITDSNSSKKDILRLTGVNEQKVHGVYLAADEKFHSFIDTELKTKNRELRTKYKLPERFVLYVGDVTWNKNLVRLVDAMKQINLTLVMVGKALVSTDYDKNHPWNADLAAVQKEIIDDARFIRLGFVTDEELVQLYNMAYVFVMPSIYEGFGLPVLEAMQSGCPVVTTKGGSLPEVAEDAAYYVDPYDVTSLANGIGEVFFTEKLRETYIKKGLKQAGKFSWKQTAEQTIKAYEHVLGVR
jgi:glycosyltransferase involved in cell wall biosynthesis